MLLFFTFCFSLLQITATATQGSSDQKICLRPEYLEETYYDKSLEEGRLDLRETNIYVYREIFFKLPMVVLGWQITGKNGILNGTGMERRGIITEYTIKFLSQTANWVFINNSKTGNEIFMSLGNLAIPTTVTEVILVNPITTMSLRLYPQIWEGIPYFKIKLRLCQPETMGYPSKLKDENTEGTSVTKLSDVKKFERKHHVTTRQKKNSHKHKKVEPTCKTSATWRYTQKSSPDDLFRATGDSRQAWRAMGGLRMEPYIFSLKSKDRHNKIIKKIYLEVNFKNLTEIFGVKIGGSSNDKRWGCVTKFGILYKIEDQMNWVFYRDDYGAPRVFDMGKRYQRDCDTELTFSLPVPIRTRAIRIYPERWTNRPMLHVNFLTCSLEGINCIHPLLARGNLQRLQFGKMNGKLQEKNSIYYITIHFSEDHLTKVKAVQFIQGPSYNGITKFVLQYHDEKADWYTVNNADGSIMRFSTADIVKKSKPMTVFLDRPLNVRSLRLYPQIWKGSSPMIQINFLGCRLRTHHKHYTLKSNLL